MEKTSFLTSLSVRTVACGAMAVAAGAYLLTMNPTFGFIDHGELSAVSYTLGVAHPTGYPTITLLGWVFARAGELAGLRPVTAVNLLAVLLVSASAGALTLLYHYILGSIQGVAPHGKRKNPPPKKSAKSPAQSAKKSPQYFPDQPLTAGLLALATAFTGTWWGQSNGFEVYALHVLMLPLVSLAFLRYVDAQAGSAGSTGLPQQPVGFTRAGTVFSLLLGLSFTNHLTTIYLAPACLVYYFWQLGLNAAAFKRLLFLVPGFLLGFVPMNLWLMLRAGMEPYYNWGNPSNLWRWFTHFRGWQYNVWMFAESGSFGKQVGYFFSILPAQTAWVGLALAVAGVIWLAWQRRFRLLLWALLVFTACVVIAAGYQINDIDSYFLAAFFAVGVLTLAGLQAVRAYMGSGTALGLAAGLVLLTGVANFAPSSERGNTMTEDMTVNVLTTLPAKAIVFSSQWDYWVSGSFYMQTVENMRPDVLVVDPELLRRSWYLDQMTRNHPQFMAAVKTQTAAFRVNLDKFEHNLPYDAADIQATYTDMINAMIRTNMGLRPVVVMPEVPAEIGPGFKAEAYQFVPWHLGLLVATDSAYVPQPFPQYRFRQWTGHTDLYTAKVSELYAGAMFRRGAYEKKHGHDSLAMKYLDYALSFDPKISTDALPTLTSTADSSVRATADYFIRLSDMRRNASAPGAH